MACNANYSDRVTLDALFSSNPNAGAEVDPNSKGARFTVTLDNAIEIPYDAFNVTVECVEATIWYTYPNITDANNSFSFTYLDPVTVLPVTTLIQLDTGLYSYLQINEAVKRILFAGGHPTTMFLITADVPTGRIVIEMYDESVTLDFSVNNSLGPLLAFDDAVLVAEPTASNLHPTVFYAPTTAKIKHFDYYLIHCDIVDDGLRINNAFNQILTTVLVDKGPGSQLIHRPFEPVKVNSDQLIGTSRTRIECWLTDNNDVLVDTFNEYWDFRIKISYSIPQKT
jgi:hypothetical protein